MDFEELVTKVAQITQLNDIQASRLVTSNLMILTRSVVATMFSDDLPTELTDMIVEAAREAAGASLEFIHAQ